jgi:hypothetical protein
MIQIRKTSVAHLDPKNPILLKNSSNVNQDRAEETEIPLSNFREPEQEPRSMAAFATGWRKTKHTRFAMLKLFNIAHH